MTEAETKQNLLIAFSGYATHKKDEVSLDKWFEVQDMKRNDPVFKKRYDSLRTRK